MKDELDRKIMKKFVAQREKTYRYLTDDKDESQKVKGTRKGSQKGNLNLNETEIVYNHLGLKIK